MFDKKTKSIMGGNLNWRLSYLITTVLFSVLMAELFGWESKNSNFLFILLDVNNNPATFLNLRDLYLFNSFSRNFRSLTSSRFFFRLSSFFLIVSGIVLGNLLINSWSGSSNLKMDKKYRNYRKMYTKSIAKYCLAGSPHN